MLKITIYALKYFGAVFAIGFALGIIRVVCLVPRLGERTAELLELPWMLVATIVLARWLFPTSDGVEFSLQQRAAIGSLALAFLLAAELGVVIFVRGESLGENIAGRDPVAGIFYLGSLGLFAAMPSLVVGQGKRKTFTSRFERNIHPD